MKRMSLMAIAAAIVGVALIASLVQADKSHSGWRGKCTDPIPADKQADLLKQFGGKGIDADKNGTLTCDEVKAFFESHPELRKHHHDGPPPCTDPIPADKQAELLKSFGDKGIDADKNGTLTCDEVKAFFDANPSLRPHPACGPPPCTDPIPADKQAELLKRFGDKGIDADKNGTLTCDEVKAFFKANPPPEGMHHHGWCGQCTDPIPADKQADLLKRFGDKGIDADKNGTLTCDEVKAFFASKFADKKGGCSGKESQGGVEGASAGNPGPNKAGAPRAKKE